MSGTHVSVEELEATRERMITDISGALTKAEKDFLISFKSLAPKWPLLGLPNIDKLPAVRWKLFNLGRMNKAKHARALKELESVLYPE